MKKQYTTPVIKFVKVNNESLMIVVSPNSVVEGTTPDVPTEEIDVVNPTNPTTPDDGMND